MSPRRFFMEKCFFFNLERQGTSLKASHDTNVDDQLVIATKIKRYGRHRSHIQKFLARHQALKSSYSPDQSGRTLAKAFPDARHLNRCVKCEHSQICIHSGHKEAFCAHFHSHLSQGESPIHIFRDLVRGLKVYLYTIELSQDGQKRWNSCSLQNLS